MANDSNENPKEGKEKPKPALSYKETLVVEGEKEKLKSYEQYVREHRLRLRRLEREARGIMVPGNYDDEPGR